VADEHVVEEFFLFSRIKIVANLGLCLSYLLVIPVCDKKQNVFVFCSARNWE